MWVIRGVVAPRVRRLLPKSVVEQGARPFVAAVSFESLRIVGYRPVGRFVYNQATVFQPRERSADRALVDLGSGGDLAGLKRTIVVGSEKPEDSLRHRKLRERFLAGVFEGVTIDGHR